MSVRPSRPQQPSAPPRADRPSSAAPLSQPNPGEDTNRRAQVADGFEAAPARSVQIPVERTSPRPLRIIITGYGDFAGVYNEAEGRPNPSGVLARRLGELGLTNAQVEVRHLEVTHAAVEAFMAEVRENPPDLILSMGVSSKAQVEERPENWKSDAIDGRGQRIDPGPISDTFEPRVRLSTDLPVAEIERALRDAYGAEQSPLRTVATDDPARTGPDEDYFPDASAYLCNYLNFRLTETFGADDRVTAGFVHVTAKTTADEMRVIAQALVDHAQRQKAQQVIPNS